MNYSDGHATSMTASRRLSDKIVDAHRIACQQGLVEIADILMVALEHDLSRHGGLDGERRENIEALEAAYELHKESFGRLPGGMPVS